MLFLIAYFIVKYIFRFCFQPKISGIFPFRLFFDGKENLFFCCFYFMAEKVKSIFGQPLVCVLPLPGCLLTVPNFTSSLLMLFFVQPLFRNCVKNC